MCFSCFLLALVGKAMGDLVCGSRGRANKMREGSGRLPGTIESMYPTTPSSTHLLSTLCRFSIVRKKYDDKSKSYIKSIFFNSGFFYITTRPMMGTTSIPINLKKDLFSV